MDGVVDGRWTMDSHLYFVLINCMRREFYLIHDDSFLLLFLVAFPFFLRSAAPSPSGPSIQTPLENPRLRCDVHEPSHPRLQEDILALKFEHVGSG